MAEQSLRAKLVERRTYIRPINEAGDVFETKSQAVDRQIAHQRRLWENAKKKQFSYMLHNHELHADERRAAYDAAWKLTPDEEWELLALRELIESRKASLSGRVKWMAGTAIIEDRPATAFNCSFTDLRIPADFVDCFWLLLQGCGVGFKPRAGLLSGFSQEMVVRFVGSTRTGKGGRENTVETFDGETWTISFGDSAKGWAKGVGKLLAHKYRAKTLVLDLSELRPAGQRLKGYGWISSGWEPFAKGLAIITAVLNTNAGETLSAIAIGDCANALGTVLSSRRSAQIWLLEEDAPEIEAFIHAKDRDETGSIMHGFYWREQSNNSIAFLNRPSKKVLTDLLTNVLRGGEPGLYNLARSRQEAPWAEGTNPCGEIRLPSKGFCNLVQIVWSRFNGDYEGLKRATIILARANYRQTLVDMRDGVLQLQWNDNNKLLRLCGVSPTGIVGSEAYADEKKIEELKEIAIASANSMADDVGENRPALVTQVQPNGTGSKVLGEIGDEVQEGAHVSPSRFIFNNINFSRHDPLVEKCFAAGYKVTTHPTQPEAVLIAIPVAYPESDVYEKVTLSNGEVVEVSKETAIDQLERYRKLMTHWVQHNCSITISFDKHEIKDIVEWLYAHWDEYIGVSFAQRNHPEKTAEDLGFAYLPQEAVSEDRYWAYVNSLHDVSLDDDTEQDNLDELTACTVGGACPIK